MDPNNFNPEGQAAPQPMGQPVPPVDQQSVQPTQPMSQPMTQQPYQGQPMPGQPMMQQPYPGQPYPGQPMYQPMPVAPKPPKQPMDPAKKKKIILACSLTGAALVIGIALAIILPIVLRVDYSEAFHKVKELKTAISEVYDDYDCGYVESYVASTYTSDKTYEEYVNGCRDTGKDVPHLIEELGATAGVQKNGDIKAQFEAFKNVYNSAGLDSEQKEAALKMYTIWHKWTVAANKNNKWDQTDADLTANAKILIDSGIEEFKTYGEGWLEKRKAAAEAYRAWWNASYSAGNYYELRDAKDNTQTAFENYRSANKPSVSDFPSVTFPEASRLRTEFTKLYDLIMDTYEKNYNAGSEDCLEFLGEVVCS